MPHLLDTSVAILLRDGDPATLNRIDALVGRPLISVISRVELEGGVYREPARSALLRQRLDTMLAGLDQLDFQDEQAVAYGQIVAALGYSRRQVAGRMIAAQAIVAQAMLVTLNPRDFAEIPGLTVEDWSA